MKSEQRVNEGSFTGAVRTEQTDSFATQIATQVLQDLPAAEGYTQTMQVDNRRLSVSRSSFGRFLRNRSGKCHTLFITLCLDNSKRIRVRRPYPLAERRQCKLTLRTALKFCRSQEFRSGTQVC